SREEVLLTRLFPPAGYRMCGAPARARSADGRLGPISSSRPPTSPAHDPDVLWFPGLRFCGIPPPAQRDRWPGAIPGQTQGHLLALQGAVLRPARAAAPSTEDATRRLRVRAGRDCAWKIKPAGYADDEMVIQQWDEILRMIATIKLKEVTASDLFRRLNSYSKQHALYRALKAFGQFRNRCLSFR